MSRLPLDDLLNLFSSGKTPSGNDFEAQIETLWPGVVILSTPPNNSISPVVDSGVIIVNQASTNNSKVYFRTQVTDQDPLNDSDWEYRGRLNDPNAAIGAFVTTDTDQNNLTGLKSWDNTHTFNEGISVAGVIPGTPVSIEIADSSLITSQTDGAGFSISSGQFPGVQNQDILTFESSGIGGGVYLGHGTPLDTDKSSLSLNDINAYLKYQDGLVPVAVQLGQGFAQMQYSSDRVYVSPTYSELYSATEASLNTGFGSVTIDSTSARFNHNTLLQAQAPLEVVQINAVPGSGVVPVVGGAVNISSPGNTGEGLTIPDFSWIRPQTASSGMYVTNGDSPDPTLFNTLHLDSGNSALYAGSGTAVASQISCNSSGGVFIASNDTVTGSTNAFIDMSNASGGSFQFVTNTSAMFLDSTQAFLGGPALGGGFLQFTSTGDVFLDIPSVTPSVGDVLTYTATGLTYQTPSAGPTPTLQAVTGAGATTNIVSSFTSRLLVGGATDDGVNSLQVDSSMRVGDTTDATDNFVSIYSQFDQSTGVKYREWDLSNSFGFDTYYDGTTNTFYFDAVESNLTTGTVMSFDRANRTVAITNSISTPKITSVPTGSIAYTYGENSSGALVKSGQVLSSTNPATLTPDASTTKQINANAQAQALTINVPTNPTDGAKVIYRIRATATSALTWSASFVDLKGTLPTSAPINKTIYVGTIYNGSTSSWEIVSVVEQA